MDAPRDQDLPGEKDNGAAQDEEPLPEAPLSAIVEALLFASLEPVSVEEMTELLGTRNAEEILSAVESLESEYVSRGSGLRLQKLAGGFRITTDSRLAPFLREMVKLRNRSRLSKAALETLAIVAYKQPITAPEIQEIRGVNPSAILGSLLDSKMVRILGRKRVVGKPFLYGTTREFLLRFGLNTLDDLPSLEEFTAMIQSGLPEETSSRSADTASGTGDGPARTLPAASQGSEG